MATPRDFRREFENAGPRLFKALRKRMLAYGRTFARRTMPIERMTGRPGLKVRSGVMRRSFDAVESGNDARTWELIVYTTSKQAPIQEFGGTVTPKGGRPNGKLAIPLPAAQTAAGVARGPARSFSDTFIAKSKAGNLLIFQKRGDGIVPLFALKDRVYVPPRLGMFDEWDEGRKERGRLLEGAARDALKDGGRRG